MSGTLASPAERTGVTTAGPLAPVWTYGDLLCQRRSVIVRMLESLPQV